MVIPILYQGQHETDAYLPKGRWYDLQKKFPIDSNGGRHKMTIPLEEIRVLQKSGTIITTQTPKQTTDETRKGDFALHAIPDPDSGKATGNLYWDSGDSIDPVENKLYSLITFSLDKVCPTLSSSLSDPFFFNFPFGRTQ